MAKLVTAVWLTTAILLAVASTTITTADAFSFRPKGLFPLAAPKRAGEHLWKPSGAVTFNENTGAVRLSKSPEDCTGSDCRAAVVFTTDEGRSFHVDDRAEVEGFCGAAGVKKMADEYVSIVCIGKPITDDGNETALTFSQTEYRFVAGATTVEVIEFKETAVFAFPPEETNLVEPTSLLVGDSVAYFPNRNDTLARNIELTLSNGTAVHAFYRSTDNGSTWAFVSVIPFPIGSDSALHVLGATKVMVIAGAPNEYMQAISVFIGSKWEKVENVTYGTSLSTTTSQFGTTAYGGLRGRPGNIGMVAGKKKGSETLLDFALDHNRMAARLEYKGGVTTKASGLPYASSPRPITNYTTEFINASEYGDCRVGGSVLDSDGCASSSFTAILALGTNGTSVFAVYDKLSAGYNPTDRDDDTSREASIYAIKYLLNETTEIVAAEKKLEDDAAADERRIKAEEQRKEAQRETARRNREKKRAKARADKKKRREFVRQDRPNINEAKAMAEADSDPIIVRDVMLEYIDHEKDMFFDELNQPDEPDQPDQPEATTTEDAPPAEGSAQEPTEEV